MSSSEVINLTINATEVRSISEVASMIVGKIGEFAERYGIADQFDARTTEEDILFFLVKRRQLGLERLEVHALEGGEIAVGSFSGRRIATLAFNIQYSGGRGFI